MSIKLFVGVIVSSLLIILPTSLYQPHPSPCHCMVHYLTKPRRLNGNRKWIHFTMSRTQKRAPPTTRRSLPPSAQQSKRNSFEGLTYDSSSHSGFYTASVSLTGRISELHLLLGMSKLLLRLNRYGSDSQQNARRPENERNQQRIQHHIASLLHYLHDLPNPSHCHHSQDWTPTLSLRHRNFMGSGHACKLTVIHPRGFVLTNTGFRFCPKLGNNGRSTYHSWCLGSRPLPWQRLSAQHMVSALRTSKTQRNLLSHWKHGFWLRRDSRIWSYANGRASW